MLLFSIRVKSDVHIKPMGGKTILLRNLGKTLDTNKPVWYEQISYRSDGKITGVNLAAVVAGPEEGKEPDPWFLVTNLKDPQTAINRYHERFHIEEWFKDLKHQLGIATIQTRNLMRIRRLLFLATVSYVLLMLAGTVIEKEKDMQDSLITGGRNVASRIWFAAKIIRHGLCGGEFWKQVQMMGLGP